MNAAGPATETGRRPFDVCNGDADGLCAVRQWRMYQPVAAILVTGLKREIGRAAAGGIDHLPAQDLGRFVQAFDKAW
jgi:hypothetical protein